MNSVQQIKEKEKCCGCGICAAICPVGAIRLEIEQNGRCEPCISDSCVSCGACLTTCPQYKFDAEKNTESKAEKVICKLVRTKDAVLLHNAASGGFVTTLVQALLQNSDYAAAFLVDSSRYGRVIQTRRVKAGDDLASTQKSRYVQISHTEEIAYILQHKEEKVILVGTPCYIRGFLKVVEQYGLNRDNYLLIGLFCERTMTTHVWDYFDKVFAHGALEALHFKSKVGSEWPGDIRLFLKDGEQLQVPRVERMDIKDYFMPRCCLDCMDKLNAGADFSTGDNYVTRRSGGPGGNSVIIRTDRAAALWERYKDLYEFRDCSMEDILKSQYINDRKKELKRWAMQMDKIQMGENGEYDAIREQVLVRRKKNSNIVRKVLSRCKRSIKKLIN